MKCRECGSAETKVMESRELEDAIRRRRQCLSCGFRFTTYERIEVAHLSVVKRDGRRESFDREKIAGGIYRACEKRPISLSVVTKTIEDIERDLRSRAEPEISSLIIGELVMSRLMELDDVAYVRFASVYRSFKDVAGFEQELAKLKERK